MKVEFTLPERVAGFAKNTANAGQTVNVVYRRLIPPDEAAEVQLCLEQLQLSIFGHIPKFPSAAGIEQIVVVVAPDLKAVAYINEPNATAQIKLRKQMNLDVGTPIYVHDVLDVASIDLGIDMPKDSAVVVMRSHGWRRAVYFDFGPLQLPPRERTTDLTVVLAKQAAMLMGLSKTVDPTSLDDENPPAASTDEDRLVLPVSPDQQSSPPSFDRVAAMLGALRSLEQLLAERVTEEARYQAILADNSWMLGGQYTQLVPHVKFDDRNIPDFTGVRSRDKRHDIIEIKQPFAAWFKKDGEFSGDFNAAWNQAERYLVFSRTQHAYLKLEKGLDYDNARCLLLLGHDLTEDQLKKIREKESLNPLITLVTYDQLLSMARALFNVVARSIGYNPTDSERIVDLASLFDRAAFYTAFQADSTMIGFRQALDDTVLGLKTGLRKTREGAVVRHGSSRDDFVDPSLRAAFAEIERSVVQLRTRFDEMINAGKINRCDCEAADCIKYTNTLDAVNELNALRAAILNDVRRVHPGFSVALQSRPTTSQE